LSGLYKYVVFPRFIHAVVRPFRSQLESNGNNEQTPSSSIASNSRLPHPHPPGSGASSSPQLQHQHQPQPRSGSAAQGCTCVHTCTPPPGRTEAAAPTHPTAQPVRRQASPVRQDRRRRTEPRRTRECARERERVGTRSSPAPGNFPGRKGDEGGTGRVRPPELAVMCAQTAAASVHAYVHPPALFFSCLRRCRQARNCTWGKHNERLSRSVPIVIVLAPSSIDRSIGVKYK
jgi:hypothetical protein